MFSDPAKIVEQSGIQAGMDIADFGSGVGAYALAAAKALVSTGRVYAIDVQKELLSTLKNTAVRQGLYNVEVIWGNIEEMNGTKLRDASIDLVFLCNILFQTEIKDNIVNEIKRVLKPASRVVVVDWADSFGGIGPKQNMVIKKETTIGMFEKGGFHLEREIPAGSHHYGLIFKKL